MAYNDTIDLIENDKSKPSSSQTRDDNLQAIANNSNIKKIKENKITSHQGTSKNLKSIINPKKTPL